MYYFASDTHLGLDYKNTSSIDREREVVRWLDMVSADAKAIFLVGDIFDFWFEYRKVVPKGHTRLLGKIASITDSGIAVHFFAGNHDLWVYDYLDRECGMTVHPAPVEFDLYGKRVFIGHGDNVGEEKTAMDIVTKRCFRSKFLRSLFSRSIHPDLALRFGAWWSVKSRSSKSVTHEFRNEEEPQIIFARKYLKDHKVDYFVFGHIHSLLKYDLGEQCSAFFLGEWFENPAYAVLTPDGEVTLKRFPAIDTDRQGMQRRIVR